MSVPKEKKLYMIEIQPKSFRFTAELNTRQEPLALHAMSNGDIAVSWDNPVAFGILKFHQSFIFDENVYFDRDKSGRIIKSFLYMGVDEDRSRVIQPC